LVGLGLLVGLPCALVLGQYVAALLFATQPTDWRIAAAASATLGVVTLFAGLAPAYRAMRLDPLAALRQE
jgi:putative ABC transport system permease protein